MGEAIQTSNENNFRSRCKVGLPDPDKDPMFLTEPNLLKETKQVHFTPLCVSKRTSTDLHSIVQLLERTVSPQYVCEVIYEMFHILNCGFEIK